MIKTFILCLVTIFSCQISLAQSEWLAHSSSSTTYFDSDQDMYGNTYVIGKGPTTIENYSITINGAYIVKYDSTGNLIWFKQLGNTLTHLSTDSQRIISVTDSGDVYVIDSHHNLDAINGSSMVGFPSNPLFIGKLDAAGNYIWTKEIELNTSTYFSNISHDANGDCYVVTSSNFNDHVFYQKYNGHTGSLIWHREWENISNQSNRSPARDLVCDDIGNCYITGSVIGNAVFLNDTSFSTPNNSREILLIKYDSSGTRQWLRTFGDQNESNEDGLSLALTDNEIYMSSYHGDDILFDNIPVRLYNYRSFTKLHQQTGQVIWSKGHRTSQSHDITIGENETIFALMQNMGGVIEYDTFYFDLDDANYNGYEPMSVMRVDSNGNFMDLRKYSSFSSNSTMTDILWRNNQIKLCGQGSFIMLHDTSYSFSGNRGFLFSIPIRTDTIKIDSAFAPLGCNNNQRRFYATTSEHHRGNHFFINVSNNIGTYLHTQSQGFPYKPKFEITRSLDSIEFSNTSGYPFKVKHTARICATNPFHCSEPFSIGTAKIDFQLIDTICLGDTIELSAINALSYQWSNPYFSDTLNSVTARIAPDSTSYIYLDALTQINCISKDSVLVKVIDLKKDNLLDTLDFPCNDVDGQLVIQSTTIGGSGNYSSTWFPNYNILNTNVDNPTILRGNTDMMYYVTMTDNFYQCTGRDSIVITADTCNVIRGRISTDGNNPLQSSIVELYIGTVDSLLKTIQTDLNGQYSFITSDTTVYIRAKPLETLYPLELNTYYDSTFLKSNAFPIHLMNDTTELSFSTLTPSDSMGSITFTGQIFYYDTPSVPVQNLEIQLVQANSQLSNNVQNINNLIVRQATTDNDGLFVFDDLPIGNYEIWGNTDGLNNQLAVDFSLNNNVTNIVFYWQDSTLLPCVSTQNSNCILINGTIYSDLDSNCLQTIGETPYANHPIKIEPGPIYVSTDSTGYYSIFALVDTFSISTTLPFTSYWEETCTDLVYNIVMDTVSTSTVKRDFGFRPANYYEDAQSYATHYTPIRPGFNTNTNIAYQNIGTLDLYNVTLVLHHDTSLIYQSNNFMSPVFVGADRVEWLIDTIKIGKSANINITFNLIPDVNLLGDTLYFISEVVPTNGEQTPLDNYDTTSVIVTGSYDPNDKRVSPGYGDDGKILKDVDKLTYTIRFQNTGTDTAFTVVIVDTLENQLDPLTLRTLSSSHPYTFSMIENGIAKWTFNNILLPDSTTNLEGSNGFVKFEINFKDSTQIGDTIKNQGAIYFDFNPPIFTNTVLSTVVEEIIYINTYEKAFENKVLFQLFPNPTKDYCIVQTNENAIYRIEVFDALGRKTNEQQLSGQQTRINTTEWINGIYYIKISNENGYSFIQKLIKN